MCSVVAFWRTETERKLACDCADLQSEAQDKCQWSWSLYSAVLPKDRNSGKSGCLIHTNQNQPELTPTPFWWLRKEEGSSAIWKIGVSPVGVWVPTLYSLAMWSWTSLVSLYFCRREWHRDSWACMNNAWHIEGQGCSFVSSHLRAVWLAFGFVEKLEK